MEVFLYDPISKVSTNEIRRAKSELKEDEDLIVRFNTPGGSYFEGAAIWALLQTIPNRTIAMIDSLAASAGAFAAMGADEVLISNMGQIMIHSASLDPGSVNENQQEGMLALTKKLNDAQIKVFAQKMKMRPSRVANLLKAETWFSSAEAISAGLADGDYKEVPIAAYHKLITSNMKTIDTVKAFWKAAIGGDLTGLSPEDQELIKDGAKEVLEETEKAVKAKHEGAEGLDVLDSNLVKQEEFETFKGFAAKTIEELIAIAENLPTEEEINARIDEKSTEKFQYFMEKIVSRQQVPTAANGQEQFTRSEKQTETFDRTTAEELNKKHYEKK